MGLIKIIENDKMYEIKIRQNLMCALKTLRYPKGKLRGISTNSSKSSSTLRPRFKNCKSRLQRMPTRPWRTFGLCSLNIPRPPAQPLSRNSDIASPVPQILERSKPLSMT